MRIALVSGTFLPMVGGLEWKVHFLATEYVRNGHEVVVFHDRLPCKHGGPLPIKPHYSVIPLGLRGFSGYGRLGIASWLCHRQILAYHRRNPIDVIHCHGIDLPTRYGLLVKLKTGVPVVATTAGHDVIPMSAIGWTLRTRPFYEKLIRQNMCAVDAVGAISLRVRKELEQMVSTARILDIPNGVDWDAFQVKSNDYLRDKLRLPSSAITLVAIGRNQAQKDFPTALKAFALAAEANPRAHLVIVGPGTQQLQALARRSGFENRIHLLGPVPMAEIPKLLWSASAFFSTSLVEGFAQVLVQAMSCARPCVLSDCSGNEDFLGSTFARFGKAGVPESLAEALKEVLADDKLRREMGAAAHTASRRYGWSIIASEYLTVFKRLITNRLKPS